MTNLNPPPNEDSMDKIERVRIGDVDLSGSEFSIGCARRWYNEHASQAQTIDRLERRVAEQDALLNTPEVDDFAKGAVLEAAHQRVRWPSEHDEGKSPFDWFWLVGYLAQKAATSAVSGNNEKARHHTISTAAALANWHLALSGTDTSMRPGIADPDPGENWICVPCDVVNYGIRKICRFCKQPRAALNPETSGTSGEGEG